MTEYDYIVVGAGSAGCVIAGRLSDDPDIRVLVLEAGGPDTVETISVPPAWPAHWQTDVDWDYELAPQAAFDDAVHRWPRGRVLGGSSSINAMVHLRGHRANYDAWSTGGAKGWSYDDLLPLFMRMEDRPGGDERYRATGGPLEVGPAENAHPLSEAFVTAAVAAGYPRTDDFNAEQQTGVGLHDLAIRDGARRSAAVAWLHPAAARDNVEVRTGAHVLRLVVESSVCTGVELADGAGGVERVRAGREVIVSGGAIGSPHLLLRSGIGPADELRSVGVEVVCDLREVGKNLHDHPMSGVVYEASRPIPEAVNNHAEASALLHLEDVAEPDLQLMFITVPFHPPTVTAPENSYTIGVAVMKPDSRGEVRLATADPDAAPIVDPRYLDAEHDVARLVDGLRLARTVGEQGAFDDWRAAEALPGPDLDSDDELRAYLRRGTGQYYHPVGTCRMGADDDAVVDSELRVRGISSLRVADASIMPSIVSVNTNPASLVIGEKAADLVREGR